MEQEKIERNYKEEYKNQKAYVVTLNCEFVGVWRNLKKLCTEMKEQDSDFQSYWTLTRKKDELSVKFETNKGSYIVSFDKLK